MLKLLVICPVFREKRFWERWRLLVQLHDNVDVTLLAPRRWRWGGGADGFGTEMVWRGQACEEQRFRVRVVDMPQTPLGWCSFRLPFEIARLQPDLVYYIGHEMEYALSETILATRLFAPRAKLANFTMRSGEPHDQASRSVRLRLRLIHRCNSAMFCHYPEARQVILAEGFPGSVYIQTQIGVDARFYRRSEELREATRRKYGLGDAFVFGSATRLALAKGVMEILQALPPDGNWRYLMLGSGPAVEEQTIRAEVARLGLQHKVVMPGLINWQEMNAHWSAMDCLVHVPRTTSRWVDTFPIAVAQGMATSLPIIGNTSGAVPYQLGDEAVIVPEGDIAALRQAMCRMMAQPVEARRMGERLRQRVLRTFDITHLSHCFYATMQDIVKGVFDERKIDQTHFGD